MTFFGKSGDPVMGKLDGWDGKAIYQMVPVRGTRHGLTVKSANEPLELVIEPPGFVRFPAPRAPYRLAVDANKTVTFDLEGEAIGRADVKVRKANQEILETMRVSVKDAIKKTYSLNVVSDMVHKSPWVLPGPDGPEPKTSIRPMMELVEAAFRRQALILLKNPLERVFKCHVSDLKLGDPIELQRFFRQERKQLLEMIVDRSDPNARQVDIMIFFTWNIIGSEDALGFTSRGGKSVFVAFAPNELKKGLTTAHEIGHALGLFHGNSTDTLMAEADTNTNAQLEASEIDRINTMGT